MSKLINPKLLESEKEIQELKKQVQDLNNKINSFKYSILWKNPNPNTSFSGNQTITLSSDNYDLLLLLYKTSYQNNNLSPTLVIPKGYSGKMITKDNNAIVDRNITYEDDTHYTFSNAYRNDSVINNDLVPIHVIGIKSGLSLTD